MKINQFNPILENLVKNSEIVRDQLYIIQDELSEATYLLCFDNNQRKLREKGYNNVATAFLFEIANYNLWRMEHPFKEKMYNIRRVNHLGHDMLMSECNKGSTKGRLVETYPLIKDFQAGDFSEGNTLHKEKSSIITLERMKQYREGD